MSAQAWPRSAKLDAPRLADRIAEITGVRLVLEGPCPGGEVGAAYVRWPDGRRSVLSEGRSRTGPVVDLARAAGVPTARQELSAHIDGVRVIVQQRLPGTPPATIDASLVHQMVAINDRFAGLLADAPPDRHDPPALRRPDGTHPDGTRSDGTRSDGTRSDGTRSDGTRSDGTRSNDTHPDRTRPATRLANRPPGLHPGRSSGRRWADGAHPPAAGDQDGRTGHHPDDTLARPSYPGDTVARPSYPDVGAARPSRPGDTAAQRRRPGDTAAQPSRPGGARVAVQPVDLYLTGDGPGFCLHDPPARHSSRTARLLAWVHEVGAAATPADGDDLVHLDFTPANVLVTDGRITGVVDWDGASRGDRHLDLVVLRFSLLRRAPELVGIVDDRLASADPDRLRAYWAHISLRQVDWSIRHHDAATVDQWLDIAELGMR